MLEDLKKLLKVQERDVEILKINEQKVFLPRMLDDFKKAVEEKNKELEAARSVLKEIQVAHKKLEIELESKETNRRKYEAQLMTVKTNQEYKAVEKEIFGMKADASKLEDEILEKMMGLDAQNTAIKKIEGELQDLKNKYAQKEQEVKQKIKELDEKLARLKEEREGLVKDIDPELFRRYNRILAHVKGEALVPIVERSCQGCHTLLPPQVFVDIRRGKELIFCENCARLLFIPEQMKITEDPDAPVGTSVEPL